MNNPSDDLDFGQTIRGFVAEQKMFGRYTLRRMLGRGGMGIVWLAKDEQLGDEVALKFVSETVRLDPVALEELKRETRRSRQLTHEHIVRIHDFAQDSECAAISMEYVDGWTLAALRAAQPQLFFEVDVIAGWIGQVCEGLSYAHDRAKIVHRDIKPANIMILRSGDVKIADFGISGSLSESLSRISMAPSASGTLAYMSPQQMLGDAPSVGDDIYSLGATIYELLTGKPPFFRGDLATQLRSKVPPSISERRRELSLEGTKPIPAAWERIVASCLDKEPSRRPQSIAAVVAGLFSEPAPAPSLAALPAKGVAPNRREALFPALIAGAGLVVLLVLLALGGAAWYLGIYQPRQVRLQMDQTFRQQNEASAKRAAELDGMLAAAQKAAAEKRWVDAQKQIELILKADPKNAAAEKLRQTVAQAGVKTFDTYEPQFLGKATPSPSATPTNPLQAMTEAGVDPFEKMKAPISPEAQSVIDRTFARIFSSGSRLAGQEVTFAGQVIAVASANNGLCVMVAQKFNTLIPNIQVDCARLPQEMRESLFSLKQAQLVEVSAKLGSNGASSMVPKNVRAIEPSEIGPVVEKMEAFLAATQPGSSTPSQNAAAIAQPQDFSKNMAESLQSGDAPRYQRLPSPGPASHVLDFNEALQRANTGDAHAQAVVSFYYGLGYKTSKDTDKSVEYAMKSAAQRHPLGIYRVGAMRQSGEGMAKDETQGKKLKTESFSELKAKSAGDPYALTALGVMLFKGDIVGQDRAEAARLYHVAADMGYAPAQYNYACCLDLGAGVEKDSQAAGRYLQQAIDQNYPPALGGLSR